MIFVVCHRDLSLANVSRALQLRKSMPPQMRRTRPRPRYVSTFQHTSIHVTDISSQALPQKYSHYRKVRGDGKCGWRGKSDCIRRPSPNDILTRSQLSHSAILNAYFTSATAASSTRRKLACDRCPTFSTKLASSPTSTKTLPTSSSA